MGKKARGKRIKKIISIIGWILLVFVCAIMILAVLLAVDHYHAEIDRMAGSFKIENYFKGEVWFSVIATCLAAFPGIICGIFALIQTNRIHKLENRYHRPSLRLRQASLDTMWIRDGDLHRIPMDPSKYRFIRQIKSATGKQGDLLSLSLELEVKNDIEIEAIEIEDVLFKIAGKEYDFEIVEPEKSIDMSDERTFERGFKDGQYLYNIHWSLYPYVLQKKSTGNEEEFWEAMEFFTNFENWTYKEYRSLWIEVTGKIYYEYAKRGYEKITGKIFWNARTKEKDKEEGRNGCLANRKSSNGYFSYND